MGFQGLPLGQQGQTCERDSRPDMCTYKQGIISWSQFLDIEVRIESVFLHLVNYTFFQYYRIYTPYKLRHVLSWDAFSKWSLST